jgi:hypothetical protein
MDRSPRLLQYIAFAAKNLKENGVLLTALFLIPLGLALVYLEGKASDLKLCAQRIEALSQKASVSIQQKERHERIWNLVQKSNPGYLAQAVESATLLVPELQRVQALARQYPENRALQERLSFLQRDRNRIRFIQQTERQGSCFRETELQMQHQVQMNEADLKKFLAAVEGEEKQDRPLFVIKDLVLKKQKEKADETVYLVQAELIKRGP